LAAQDFGADKVEPIAAFSNQDISNKELAKLSVDSATCLCQCWLIITCKKKKNEQKK